MQQKILLFDLETAPLLAHVWSAKTEYIPYTQMIHDSFLLAWSGKFYGEPTVFGDYLTGPEARKQSDKRIVKSLASAVQDADILIAHNIDRFDVPMLNNRLLLLGLEPMGPVRTLDTLKLSQKAFRLAYNKLDYLASALGLPRKIKTDFDLWMACYHGDEDALDQMFEYNQQDVVVLEQVFDKIKPYVRNLPRLFDADTDKQMACPTCGLTSFVRRGFYRTQASTFVKMQCKGCKRYSRMRTAENRLAVHPL